MDSSNLAWYFRQLVFNALAWEVPYRKSYTRSSLIGGLISGLILGDVTTGIMVWGCFVVYIALVTPGGTVSADVRAIFIGVPLKHFLLCMLITSQMAGIAGQLQLQLAAASWDTAQFFYGTKAQNLVWQHIGWKAS